MVRWSDCTVIRPTCVEGSAAHLTTRPSDPPTIYLQTMLHLRCGTDILWNLDEAGIPGRKVSWSDPLCQGPVPFADRERLRPVRARWLQGEFGIQNPSDLDDLVEADHAVDTAGEHDEIVLWFEADLFDQAILVHLLDRLGHLLDTNTRLTLVTLHEMPGVRRFIGLGQLNAAQLASLFPKRIAVTREMVNAGREAWKAWTAPTPELLQRIATGTSNPLAYLPAAVTRLLEELPDPRTGLGRTERTGLEIIARGPTTLFDAFRASQDREERPWLGDSMFFTTLQPLTRGAAPLIAAEGTWPTSTDQGENPRVTVTAAGRSVLAGEQDWQAMGAPGRWVAGTELRPGQPLWRYADGTLTRD